MNITNNIPIPKISGILREEFMEPLNLSAYALVKNINVPTSRIQDILHDQRQITTDTSIRLAKFFGVSDQYFLSSQNDIDLRNAQKERGAEYRQIQQYQLG